MTKLQRRCEPRQNGGSAIEMHDCTTLPQFELGPGPVQEVLYIPRDVGESIFSAQPCVPARLPQPCLWPFDWQKP